jgi:hypothetical protein
MPFEDIFFLDKINFIYIKCYLMLSFRLVFNRGDDPRLSVNTATLFYSLVNLITLELFVPGDHPRG